MHSTTSSAGPATLTLSGIGPLDDAGLLVHEDDPTAQLALALANVASRLEAAGLGWPDLRTLQVRTTDLTELLEVYDTLTDHLAAMGSSPRTTVVEVPLLPVPGMTVALDGLAERRTGPVSDHHHRRNAMHASTTTPTVHDSAARLEALLSACPGAVHGPGTEPYDAHRMPWNVAIDQRPAAVAVPATAEEVADVVAAAVRLGYRVAPQGTGHGAAGLAGRDLSDAVLLRTTSLTAVTVDPVARTARVESGAVWQDVVELAARHGLAALHGSSPDVGVAGYCLGGGIGWYARKHGLATNSVSAVEIVTGDGRLVRADAEHHPDLFWAVRGGGGSFGVVTALELRLLPIETAYAGMLLWDVTHAEPVLRTWAAWAQDAPDEVTTSFRVLRFPPMPELPDFLRGRSVVVVDGAVLGDDELGAAQVAALRALGPEMDTFARVPAAALSRLHMDPEGPTPNVGGSAMLAKLDDAAIGAFLAEVGPEASPAILGAELRQLGGALARPAEGGGALDRLDAAFCVFLVAVAATPEMAAAGRASIDQVLAALAPHATGGSFLNLAEQGDVDPRTGYSDAAWQRLLAVRAETDPAGTYLANHPVG